MSAAKPFLNPNKSLPSPLTLYRQILRTHRHLPAAHRALGDAYVKAEFKRHKDIDNPVHIVGFIGQWQVYLEDLKEQVCGQKKDKIDRIIPKIGKKLDSDSLEKFNEQQIGQLYELMNEAKNIGVQSNDDTSQKTSI
ncbi:6118_t:CDS:1 [Ambispora leptoticha]|uniref:Succinate dehydrogenase assembly factor 3 n=1 Tax=Ambispora leptoticha TaxID=144679 RepID=A0A9N9DWF7_9GLOM|nr:6118_t:CDS:1 [Ambispora leptoticha]